jgi:hypothetical protein
MNKGNSLYYALCHTLIHLSLSMQYENFNRVHFLDYEYLTGHAEEAVIDICRFIGQPYEPEMLQPKNNQKVQGKTRLEGWRHRETEIVRTNKKKHYDLLDQKQQKELISAMQMIDYIAPGSENGIVRIKNYYELYKHLPYMPPKWNCQPNNQIFQRLNKEKQKDKLFRLRKMQLRFLRNYPIEIKKNLPGCSD